MSLFPTYYTYAHPCGCTQWIQAQQHLLKHLFPFFPIDMKMKPSTKSKGGASRKKLCTCKVLKNLKADRIKDFASYLLEEAIYIITLRQIPKNESEQFSGNSEKMIKENFWSISSHDRHQHWKHTLKCTQRMTALISLSKYQR